MLELITITNPHIAIIGLGNIGLPLVMALGEKYPTVGFDIDASKIKRLENETFSYNLSFTNNRNTLSNYNIFIIAVPTSVGKDEKPDLHHLLTAIESIGFHLKKSRFSYLRINGFSWLYRRHLRTNFGEHQWFEVQY